MAGPTVQDHYSDSGHRPALRTRIGNARHVTCCAGVLACELAGWIRGVIMQGDGGGLGEGGTRSGPDGMTPRTAAREERFQSRLYVLDLLRFVAASLVAMYHLMPFALIEFQGDGDKFYGHIPLKISQYGFLGVEFFFVISGFVICMSSWGRGVSQFFTSRVVRLMPAYWLAVVLTAFVQATWPIPARPEPGLLQVLANLTMVQTFVGIPNIDGVYWSLAVELVFYLLFAIVVWFGVTYRRVVLFCVFWTIASVTALAVDQKLLTVVVNPEWTPYFVAGITLYLIHRFGPSLLHWGMLGVSWILCVVALNNWVAPMVKSGWQINFRTAFLIFTAFFAVMVVVALGGFSWLRWRGLVTVGALTYPVYLLHASLGQAALHWFRDDVAPWALLIGVFVGILLVSYLVHRLVERPLAKVLRRGLKRSFEKIHSYDDGSTTSPAAVARSTSRIG